MDKNAAVRSTQAKAEAAAGDTRRFAQGNAVVEGVDANLASLAEIRQMAESVRRAHPKLDGLINNAGALYSVHSRKPLCAQLFVFRSRKAFTFVAMHMVRVAWKPVAVERTQTF